MSEENVEIVRRSLDAFNAFMRGDLSREAVAEHADPQFEFHWHDAQTMPDLPQRLSGPPAFLEFWEQLRSAYDDLTLVPLEFIDAPGDRVLSLTRQSGRCRVSGVPVTVHAFHLWTIREGKVREMELSAIAPTPSKPPRCRSRRCRRRTSRS
jgi:ketosteroid isomerase-like protein